MINIEFVSFSDKKTAVNGSRRFDLNGGLAAKNLHHLPHYDSNTNQAEPQEKQGAGLGGGNKYTLLCTAGGTSLHFRHEYE